MALELNSTGSYNIAIGSNALFLNSEGDSNTAVGHGALYSNTTGDKNTAIGAGADVSGDDISNATAIGANAYASTSNSVILGSMDGVNGATASTNIGIGISTPLSKLHIKGSANVSQLIVDANSTQGNTSPLIKLRNSLGSDLLWIHSDDPSNIFIGLNAGRINFIAASGGGGVSNTFIGRDAGYSNTIGYFNTAVGMNALSFNTSGYSNTATGLNALVLSTTGYANTASGRDALYSNTTGFENTATGAGALNFNTTGFKNTAVGMNTLFSNTIGEYNTAMGSEALYNTTTGDFNVGFGFRSLYSNTTGNSNTATGRSALYNNSAGDFNTASGLSALHNNTTGHFNTAMGMHALIHNTTGINNTAMGSIAGNNGGTTPSNFAAIGYNAGHIASSSNEMEIGNTSVSWIGGQVVWGTYSDQRIKDNIQSNVPGLSFINKLNPVTYHLNIHRQNIICGIEDTTQWEGKYDIEKIIQTGFIAQEVEQAAQDSNYDFSGVKAPTGNGKLYSVQYASFVVPLVKAVQELSLENSQLKSVVTTVTLENQGLIQRIEKLESLLGVER